MVNYRRGFLFFILFISVAFCFTTVSKVMASEVGDFVNKLKAHYKSSPPLKVFSLNYHYLGGGEPYQSWDYQSPERYIAIRMVEIDLVKKQFFENDIHHFPGGKTFDRIQFQNDKESMFYDRNNNSLGKRIRRQSMDTFDELREHIFINVDFLAVTPLLEEKHITSTMTLQRDKLSREITLAHIKAENSVIEYVFNESPLQLVRINNKSARKIYIYDDYQTTNGITFARSIHKYFNGAVHPSFIHRIDQLDILEQIDPARFDIPAEFGPIIQESDRALFAKNIAPTLYVITDGSAWRNILFKVNGDEIMVFDPHANTLLAEETINVINKYFPDKKITSVYVTHPHSDHINGLPAYAKRGITIFADNYSIEAIKAYPPFANDIASFKFQAIEHEQIIDGASFYILESTRAKRQSFVYFKELGIIYQTDFLDVAYDNTIPKIIPNYTRTFIDFIRQKQLKFNRIVGHHRNNNISIEVVNKISNAHM